MWFVKSKSRNSAMDERYHRRWISPLQGKGLMFLALVFFTESIMVTKAVRTVDAFGGGSKSTNSQQQCSSSGGYFGNYQCEEPVAPPVVQRVFGVSRGGDAVTAAASDALVKMPYNIPLNGWKVIFQAILTTINVVCWLVPLKSKSFGENKLALSLANAFSGGVFLSLAFGHLIPECVDGFASALGHYNEAAPYMLVLSGYLLIFFVEKVAFDADAIKEEMEKGSSQQTTNSKAVAEAESKNTSRSAVILLAALAVHSILEMMALGLSDSFSDSALLTVSIALHQPAESIALLVAFLKSGMPKSQIITFLSVFSAMGPIGVALGMAVNEFAAPIVDAITLAVVAGTFVYVGATEVIPEEFEESEHKWKKFAALMGGIGSIYMITQYTTSLVE